MSLADVCPRPTLATVLEQPMLAAVLERQAPAGAGRALTRKFTLAIPADLENLLDPKI